MIFFLCFLLIFCIIGIIILCLKVKKVSETLHQQLAEAEESYSLKESIFIKSISGLQETLSQEQKSIKAREWELKAQERELTRSLSKAEADLKEEAETYQKLLSQKKSSEVRLGNIAEKLAPFLDDFNFNPENCTFLGQPIDYISFDDEVVTLIEIKTGKSQLNSKQRHIRDLIKDKQVAWKEIRIK